MYLFVTKLSIFLDKCQGTLVGFIEFLALLRRSPTAIPLSLFSVFELLITLITNYLEKFIKLLSSHTTSVVL